MQVVHDKIADLNHVKVKFLLATEKFIPLKLSPRHFEQFVEEVAKPEEVQIARLALLVEEFVADCRLSQLHDEVVDRADAIFYLSGVVAGHFMWLHLFPVRFTELG